MDSKNNNDPNRLITVAIHTFDRAVELKNTLEEEGIEVKLHNVNLDEKVLSSGVRVRIRERDLPQALQIIESPETTTSDKCCVLLPVDFGKYSLKSVKLGMEYARRTRGRVLLLHSYINERHTMSLPFGSDRYDSPEDEIKGIKKNARERMEEFTKMLNEKIAAGELPKVKIDTRVTEGIPEEQILHYAQKNDVSLIVMGTSGTNRRRQNLIGSVAGEVMDACKFPIFTVPIGMPDIGLTDITHVAFFSNLIQQDIISFDRFARLFNMRGVEVTIPLTLVSFSIGLLVALLLAIFRVVRYPSSASSQSFISGFSAARLCWCSCLSFFTACQALTAASPWPRGLRPPLRLA